MTASTTRNFTTVTEVGFAVPPSPRTRAADASSSPLRTTVDSRGIVKYCAARSESTDIPRSFMASEIALTSWPITGSTRKATEIGIVKQVGIRELASAFCKVAGRITPIA